MGWVVGRWGFRPLFAPDLFAVCACGWGWCCTSIHFHLPLASALWEGLARADTHGCTSFAPFLSNMNLFRMPVLNILLALVGVASGVAAAVRVDIVSVTVSAVGNILRALDQSITALDQSLINNPWLLAVACVAGLVGPTMIVYAADSTLLAR